MKNKIRSIHAITPNYYFSFWKCWMSDGMERVVMAVSFHVLSQPIEEYPMHF